MLNSVTRGVGFSEFWLQYTFAQFLLCFNNSVLYCNTELLTGVFSDFLPTVHTRLVKITEFY